MRFSGRSTLLPVVLAICAGPLAAGERFALHLITAPSWIEAAAQRALLEQFLGGTSGADLDFGGRTAHGVRLPGFGWGIGLDYRPAARGRIAPRLSLSLGQSGHDLAEGVGIFIDPGRVRMTHLTIEAELGIGLGDWRRLSFDAGLGGAASWYEVRYDSSLLAVETRGSARTGFVRLGVEGALLPAPQSLFLRADLFGYDTGGADLRLKLEQRF